MQFTSNIIVVLLLAVPTSTVSTAQNSANLHVGGSNLQEKTTFSDPSPSELSSIMNDAANSPLPNFERSLVGGIWDNCPGLEYKVGLDDSGTGFEFNIGETLVIVSPVVLEPVGVAQRIEVVVKSSDFCSVATVDLVG